MMLQMQAATPSQSLPFGASERFDEIVSALLTAPFLCWQHHLASLIVSVATGKESREKAAKLALIFLPFAIRIVAASLGHNDGSRNKH